MGRPPTHRTFHLGNLTGPAPDCDGLVRSLNARIDDRWHPVAKWCDRCKAMWPFDPDTGVQEQPKFQQKEEKEQEDYYLDDPETWYEVWVADYPGDNCTAVCRICGWRSAPHKTESAAEAEAIQHDNETGAVPQEDGEMWGGHLTGEFDGYPWGGVEYERTEATDEQWAGRWGPLGPDFDAEHLPRALYGSPEFAASPAAQAAGPRTASDIVAVEIVARDLTKSEAAAAKGMVDEDNKRRR